MPGHAAKDTSWTILDGFLRMASGERAGARTADPSRHNSRLATIFFEGGRVGLGTIPANESNCAENGMELAVGSGELTMRRLVTQDIPYNLLEGSSL